MADLTLSQLRRLWPNGNAKVPGLVEGIAQAAPSVFAKYGLTTPLLVAHAMAQFSHECGAGTEMVESIHYSAERAVQVWPNRFSSASDCYSKVGAWDDDPDFPGKLIDSVYGSRMGNRPGTHDGRTFIGRGLSQVTGRDGYAKLGAKVGLDLVNHPELVCDPAHALDCAVADFILCGCLPFAASDDVRGVTRKLNGGETNLSDRMVWLGRWKKELATSEPAPKPAAPPYITQGKPVPTLQPKHVAAGGAVVAATVGATQAHHTALIITVLVVGALAAIGIHFLWPKKG